LNGLPVGYLYANKDGKREVLVEKPCFNINTTDTKVFFKMYVEEEDNVFTYSINPDGTDLQRLE